MKALDLIGKRFGSLTVIEKMENSGSSKWLCKCDCGNEKIVFGTNLVNGYTLSCGCSRVKHGDSKSKLYGVHRQMMISGVVPEWDDYQIFKDWALENGYTDGARINRKNTELPYGPDNSIITVKNS